MFRHNAGTALFIDGSGGAIGGLVGASGQTVFVESATGVGEGARTGLASLVTGGVFTLMLFFSPLAGIVPVEVASAALVVIGSMMMSQARHIDWADRDVAIPAFLTCTLMPFTYSITAGVAAGVVYLHGDQGRQGQVARAGSADVDPDRRLPDLLRAHSDDSWESTSGTGAARGASVPARHRSSMTPTIDVIDHRPSDP